MRTMNQSLYDLVRQNVISFEEGMHSTTDPEDLKRMFQRNLAS
jgi:Tfp pilus assembly ATPase PilU